MRKIICELCGTVYPDTEECCPTCGTEKPVTAEYMPEDNGSAAPHRPYTPTRGGRFSDANVKKRLKGKGVAPAAAAKHEPKYQQPARQPRKEPPRQEQPRKEPPRKQDSGSNKGLVITAIILVIAIIAMLIYIYVTFLMPPADKPQQTDPPKPAQTLAPVPNTTAPDLSCKGITLSQEALELTQAGSSVLLNVTADPADTVDAITFVSADPNVATVSAQGLITAVGNGETVITVTCGNVTAQCRVTCAIPTETTVPETTVPETTESVITLELNREDITFSKAGEAWPLYRGEIPLNEITWSVGNESVATVRNGTVRAVGPGTTNVYAEYQGQKVKCIVRCNFD